MPALVVTLRFRLGDGDDVFSGSGLDPTAAGGTSASTLVDAGGGSDVIEGGPGTDRVGPGAGADIVRSAGGADAVQASPGAADGPDLLDLGDGLDTASYELASESVNLSSNGVADDGIGADGDNVISAERLVGGTGDDVITGTDQPEPPNFVRDNELENEILEGNAGDDLLDGRGGPDRLIGESFSLPGEGDDTLIGGPGSDVVYGTAGNDRISGDSDRDTVDGGRAGIASAAAPATTASSATAARTGSAAAPERMSSRAASRFPTTPSTGSTAGAGRTWGSARDATGSVAARSSSARSFSERSAGGSARRRRAERLTGIERPADVEHAARPGPVRAAPPVAPRGDRVAEQLGGEVAALEAVAAARAERAATEVELGVRGRRRAPRTNVREPGPGCPLARAQVGALDLRPQASRPLMLPIRRFAPWFAVQPAVGDR